MMIAARAIAIIAILIVASWSSSGLQEPPGQAALGTTAQAPPPPGKRAAHLDDSNATETCLQCCAWLGVHCSSVLMTRLPYTPLCFQQFPALELS